MNKIFIANVNFTVGLLYQQKPSCQGYKVITASDCEGLMETIEQHNPDLIILDIKMGASNSLNTL